MQENIPIKPEKVSNNVEEYKVFFDFTQKIYYEDLERKSLLEEKAYKLQTIYIFFLGLFGALLKFGLDISLPLLHFLIEYLLLSGFAIFMLFAITAILRSSLLLTHQIKIDDLEKLTLEGKWEPFFSESDMPHIYKELAFRYSEAYKNNKKIIDEKAIAVDSAHALITRTFFCTALSSIFLGFILLMHKVV